jgi:septal ring-binding cell division protein DamX
MFDESPTKLCQDNGEIFFRGSDISRFQRVFDAVVDDAQHLLVTSHYDGVIDHYGKMMLNRLKMRSGMAVETYMPASTEALVTRFNELVNSMSMEEARGEEASQTPGRIIVVNDPKAIDSDGWALLSRMVTDFPGLNMRLVFLLDRIPSHIEKALDRFGSRLLRWEVEPPTSEEQLVLRKEGMAEGLEFQVERVLSRINQTLSQQLEPSLSTDEASVSLRLDVDDALGGATEAGEREADDMRALFEEEEPKKKSGGLGFIILLLVLGVGATAIAGFVSPDVGSQLDRALKLLGVEESIFTRKEKGQSVVDAAYDSKVESTPSVSQTTLPELPALPPLPTDDGRLAEKQAATPEQTARTELTTQIAESNPAPVPQPTEETPAPEPTEETPAPEQVVQVSVELQPQPQPEPATVVDTQTAIAPPAPAQETTPPDPAMELVKSASPRQQFVQHIVLASRARATAWIATQTGVDKAIVVPINVNGATRYAVVSGPFQDRGESRAYIQGLGQGADYWVRTAGSLQRILQDGE